MAFSSSDQNGTAATSSDRLRMRSVPSAKDSYVDGGWWPASMDLAAETPGLLAELSQGGFRTRRVIYPLADWSAPPRKAMIGGRQIKFGGYRWQPGHTISVIDGTGGNRLNLLVIPPDTSAAVSRRALDSAGRDGNHDSADDILDSAAAG